MLYVLCKKFSAKYRTVVPTLLFAAIAAAYMSLPLFISGLPSVEAVLFIIFVAYALLFRNGSVWKKIFWVALIEGLLISVSLLTIAFLSVLTDTASIEIITESTNIRLVNIVIVHIIDFVVFFVLSRDRKKEELLLSPPLAICFIIPLISLLAITAVYEILLRDASQNVSEPLIYMVSFSYILINAVIFVLYEMMGKEAEKNSILAANQQKYELTQQRNNEIVRIYSDIREWRHDYTNHMQAITMLLESSNTRDSKVDEAVAYIKSLDEKIQSSSATVSTGNYIVDAIVSAKLASALSFKILFEYNAALPDSLPIDDTDMCALLSNLLDNAIEACCKLEDGRRIELEIVAIKHQMHIKITNSADGGYKREGGKFKSTKQGRWHGIGMKHIETIVKDYGGTYDVTADDKSFSTQIGIPLVGKREKTF